MLKVSSRVLLAGMYSWWEHEVLFEPKDWIQVEVTSACNAACGYCPRTVYGRQWQNRYITLETFQKILPAMSKTALVYLQGWGEPFLHPDFLTMVRMAKKAKCIVGTTTNGMLLHAGRVREAVAAGLDILAISLAGTTPRHNDAARAGTSLVKVLEKLDLIHQIKQKQRSKTPAVHLAYMLLRSGLEDLEDLPRLMAEHGVDQAVVSVLDFEPGLKLSQEVLAPQDDKERRDLEELFAKVSRRAAELGVVIHLPSFGLRGEDEPVCSENIQRALFVSADGDVSPCVYANVPVDQAEYARQGHVAHYHRVSYGNINVEILPKIWRNTEYAGFREKLVQGPPPEICLSCPKRGR